MDITVVKSLGKVHDFTPPLPERDIAYLRARVVGVADVYGGAIAAAQLFDRYAERCHRRIVAGRNRVTFLFDRYVVKMPHTHAGVDDNQYEAAHRRPEFARTRMAYLMPSGFPILVMQRVRPTTCVEIPKPIPDWIYDIDCAQVGWTSDGRLVAYDYA